MNSNNNSSNGHGGVISLIAMAAMVVVIAIYIAAILFTVVLTILCLFALKRPLKIGDDVIDETFAKRFLWNGLRGYVGGLVLFFCGKLFWNAQITVEGFAHICFAGYALGAYGITWIECAQDDAEETEIEILPPLEASKPPPQRRAFEFASWEDEETPR